MYAKKKTKMKRPNWATLVGILGVIFGCFGLLGAGQEMLMPKMLEMQKEVFIEIQKSTDNAKNISKQNNPFPVEIFKSMQKMWDVPEWFGTYSIVSGVFKFLVSSLYLLSGILLLLLKPSAIKLFYFAAGACILLFLIKGIIAFGDTSLKFVIFSFTLCLLSVTASYFAHKKIFNQEALTAKTYFALSLFPILLLAFNLV